MTLHSLIMPHLYDTTPMHRGFRFLICTDAIEEAAGLYFY